MEGLENLKKNINLTSTLIKTFDLKYLLKDYLTNSYKFQF